MLREHGLAPRRADGQNFVTDPNTVRRIVAAAGLEPDDTVLEIGPGLGSLTLVLAPLVRRVVAVELDAGLASVVRGLLADAGHDHVEVVHADALRCDLDDLVGDEPARLVANLPYNVATPLMFHALAGRCVQDAFVMVQREVGARWAADSGDPAYGAVSVKLQLQAQVEVVFGVPRAVFHPVPNVDSVMVRLTRRPDAPDRDDYLRTAALVDAAFARRRRTLRNTLGAVVGTEVLEAAAAEVGVAPTDRAEAVDAATLVQLVRAAAARR